jgi:putative two-component system response regulator
MDYMSEQADKATILVVDDTPDNLMVMRNLLKDLYRVKVAKSGEEALEITFGTKLPDLILLDIMMPEMDGYEVCRRLKADDRTRDIPIIFLTAKTETEDEQQGLDLGAVDYITKPISPPIVLARIRTHLQLKAAADFLKDENEYLEKEVSSRTHEVSALQQVTILAMTSLAETRDSETGNHIKRTQLYVKELAAALQSHPRFTNILTNRKIETLIKSTPLHDIGKIGIPDSILLKPARLDEKEYDVMKTHATIGRNAIEHAETELGEKVEFLECAKEIAYYHHEKWDGTGYPEGIAGDTIPLAARLIALVDVYDALISRRIYKPSMTHQEAVEIIITGRGKHFDPDIVDVFLNIQDKFLEICQQFADNTNCNQK